MIRAAAWELLHFDLPVMTAADRPVQGTVNWLNFAHALTFANTGRNQAEHHPENWPVVLLQIACFTGQNTKYTDAKQDVSVWKVDQYAGGASHVVAALGHETGGVLMLGEQKQMPAWNKRRPMISAVRKPVATLGP